MTRTVVREGRLIAYLDTGLSEDESGVFRSGSTERLADFADARLALFSREHEELLCHIASDCDDLDQLVFRIQLEGFELREGRVAPHANLRRF